MQARSSRRQTVGGSQENIHRRRPIPLQLGVNPRAHNITARTVLPAPSSPLARYSLTAAVDERASRELDAGRRVIQRKSICGLIPEELGGLSSDLSATLHNRIDLSSEFLKRHHKPRSSPTRTFSDPQILSTTTTQPVHIPNTMATLAPRADSFNARVRGSSHIDFKTATTGVAAKAMRNEIGRLVSTVEDPSTKKAFDTEMQSFFYLFTRYLSERAKNVDIDWDRIKSPGGDQIVPYDSLSQPRNDGNFNKLAVLKVNGGLGTSMGMTGAKSALEVKDDMTFLDLTVRQIEHLNMTNGVNVPLILMTSFNTHEDTLRIIKKYANQQVQITTFNQSRYPRIYKETLLPCPKRADDDKKHWYPPGHGDLYNAIYQSGVLDQLIAEGKEYLFVSNSDNLGAVVDEKILQHMIDSQSEFLMEVTDKTKADIKGGTLIDYEGSVRLLEIAQVPSEHVEDFKSIRKFKIFNTNNLWINLRALKRVMENEGMELEIIVNPDRKSVV